MAKCLFMILLALGFSIQAADATGPAKLEAVKPAAPAPMPAAEAEAPAVRKKKLANVFREPKIPATYVIRYDLNGDGKLSEAEIATAIQQMNDACLPILFPECDKNANGKLEKAETEAALVAAVKEYDLDEDGKLDLRETAKMNLVATKKAAQNLRRNKNDKALVPYVDRYDLNHDGKLSDDELQVAGQQMADACLPVLFKECDKNGNGLLEGNELLAARAEALKQYDLNGDGKLDLAEAMKMNLKVKELQPLEKGGKIRKESSGIKRYDLDGDGKLSDEEMARAREMSRKNIKAQPLDE